MTHMFKPPFLRKWRLCSMVGKVAQNVMAAVDFDLQFTFVMAGWEGTSYDVLILRDALERENGLRVPEDKLKFV
jgi:hypothetical protein